MTSEFYFLVIRFCGIIKKSLKGSLVVISNGLHIRNWQEEYQVHCCLGEVSPALTLPGLSALGYTWVCAIALWCHRRMFNGSSAHNILEVFSATESHTKTGVISVRGQTCFCSVLQGSVESPSTFRLGDQVLCIKCLQMCE